MSDCTFEKHKNIPTPPEGDARYIGNFLKTDKHAIRLHLDGDLTDSCGQAHFKTYGKIYYTVGYHGLALNCNSEGYVESDFIAPQDLCSAFTVSGWIRLVKFPSRKSFGEASILSNKTIDGVDSGIALTLVTDEYGKNAKLRLTVRAESGNVYVSEAVLPENARGTWVHFSASFAKAGIKIYLNFEDSLSDTHTAITDTSTDDIIGNGNPFFLAQDITGHHTTALEAELDDLIIQSGGISPDEVSMIKKYYI